MRQLNPFVPVVTYLNFAVLVSPTGVAMIADAELIALVFVIATEVPLYEWSVTFHSIVIGKGSRS
jgi:hypothetical protein